MDPNEQKVESGRGGPKEEHPSRGVAAQPLYKIGDTTKDGRIVKAILNAGNYFCTFIDQEGKIAYDFQGPETNTVRRAAGEFGRLNSLSKATLGDRYLGEVGRLLASAMHEPFLNPAGNPNDIPAQFADAENFIKKRIEDRLRFVYLIVSLPFALLVAVAFGILGLSEMVPVENLRDLALGGMGGSLGATISIVERGRKLQLEDPFASGTHMAFQGIVRAVLGVLLGIFAVIASKANIILGVIEGNMFYMIFIAAVAGYSTRFIPDVMERFAKGEKP